MLFAQDLFQSFTDEEFKKKALEIFRFQAKNNLVYQRFVHYLNVEVNKIKSLSEIPFLPISFFKDFDIVSSKDEIVKTFTSSGTTGSIASRHLITDLKLYHKQLDKSFEFFYDDFTDYTIFPLLPAYAERSGSSLIEMVDYWMNKTQQVSKEYYLYNHEKLAKDLEQASNTGKKIILIGVSFALLDFAENFPMDLSQVIVIETGGMKGRKKEMTRNELHSILNSAFNTTQIQSEYGMTELLSQAYAIKDGLFATPPWMKVMLRDPEDPLSYVQERKSGGVNVIDFTNINSCSFIATDDLGRFKAENQVEILGRFDNSDVRGCNLMAV